jgi:hypothetical protein
MKPVWAPARAMAALLPLLLAAGGGWAQQGGAGSGPVGAVPAAAGTVPLWFDDFSYRQPADLRAAGWTLRQQAGHPGVPGARWPATALSLLDDPAQAGNRLLRLTARTDGTAAGTEQAQLCHQRRALYGTYAARVRFTDAPLSGAGGDPVVQTFYAVSPLKHAFDPTFSELDWEYLPQGGWGSPAQRLYAVAWQTVQLEPWVAHNGATEVPGAHGGWRQLTVQVSGDSAGGQSRWFVDGREVAVHGGRNHPVQPMAISFSLWFSPTGLQPASAQPRVWVQDVDWVLYSPQEQLSPAQAAARVAAWRAQAVPRVDTLAAGVDAACDF